MVKKLDAIKNYESAESGNTAVLRQIKDLLALNYPIGIPTVTYILN